MERIKTGVPGFDNLIEGGFPKGFSVLLAGTPGTGKTIFSLRFLFEGLKNGEKCAYMSYVQSKKDLVDQAAKFGWDVTGIDILEKPPDIKQIMEEKHYTRLVLDSLPSLDFVGREPLGSLITTLKKAECTSMMISEIPRKSRWFSRDKSSEFLCDGVLVMENVDAAGDVKSVLTIEKMRSTKISKKKNFYDIKEKGLVVKDYSGV